MFLLLLLIIGCSMVDINITVGNIILKSVKSPPTFIRGTQMVQVPIKLFKELEQYYKENKLKNISDDEDSSDSDNEDNNPYPDMVIF